MSFRDGRGVARDEIEAYTWFDLAATRGSSDSDKTTYANARDGVAKSMSVDQINDAQKRVTWWLEGFERRRR